VSGSHDIPATARMSQLPFTPYAARVRACTRVWLRNHGISGRLPSISSLSSLRRTCPALSHRLQLVVIG